jgi:hypothetical protein
VVIRLEAFSQHPAAEEVVGLVFDEARQAVAGAAVRDFAEEALHVCTNDGVLSDAAS